jgi:hypothetical protein
MEYIGIDVHQRESQVCIVDERGQVLIERRVRTRDGVEVGCNLAFAPPTICLARLPARRPSSNGDWSSRVSRERSDDPVPTPD